MSKLTGNASFRNDHRLSLEIAWFEFDLFIVHGLCMKATNNS